MFKRNSVAGLAFASLLMIGFQAQADIIYLSPGDESYNGAACLDDDPACGPGNSAILDWLESNVAGFDRNDSLYKSDVVTGSNNGSDSGDFGDDYDTTYESDRSGATIYQSEMGSTITDPSWLLVKDGDHSPVWYLFDISAWNGIMDIELSGFWVDSGEISHVEIFGGVKVPEPATLGLLGLGLIGIGYTRRRIAAG